VGWGGAGGVGQEVEQWVVWSGEGWGWDLVGVKLEMGSRSLLFTIQVGSCRVKLPGHSNQGQPSSFTHCTHGLCKYYWPPPSSTLQPNQGVWGEQVGRCRAKRPHWGAVG
jgi:hypothetical protein